MNGGHPARIKNLSSIVTAKGRLRSPIALRSAPPPRRKLRLLDVFSTAEGLPGIEGHWASICRTVLHPPNRAAIQGMVPAQKS